MAISAVIFDLDGTLIDTNVGHVRAWDEALKQYGYTVATDRIELEIGKGGDKLVPSILGQGIDEKHGKSLRKAHTATFTKLAEHSSLVPFAGVQRLFDSVRSGGLKLALATSSSEKELATTLRCAGVEQWMDQFDVIATASDSQDSKPAPGILLAAIGKLGLAPTECVMVGDTPYDADTARDAGVVCVGVTCGGINDLQTLRATGMRAVYRDPADMADSFDDLLKIVSPGSAVLTQSLIESLMDAALAKAREGMAAGEAPIGCVIARGDGTIIARAFNEQNATGGKIDHAEMIAFRRLTGKVPVDARDLILVCTLEPCVMCLGAAMEAAVDTILYALPAPADGGQKRVRPPVSDEAQMPRLVGHIRADAARSLFQQFLAQPPADPKQAQFAEQLLRQ